MWNSRRKYRENYLIVRQNRGLTAGRSSGGEPNSGTLTKRGAAPFLADLQVGKGRTSETLGGGSSDSGSPGDVIVKSTTWIK